LSANPTSYYRARTATVCRALSNGTSSKNNIPRFSFVLDTVAELNLATMTRNMINFTCSANLWPFWIPFLILAGKFIFGTLKKM
jgi:hypothetical protein